MGFGARGEYSYGSEEGLRHPSTILEFPQKWRRQDQIHPTQKPVELFEWLLKSFSNEGETVLDFTFGSNTTGVACANTNRGYIGIELDETYFDVGLNRLKEVYSGEIKIT